MQNCRSDPALQGSRSPKPASTVTSITSRISTASKPQQTTSSSSGGAGGGGGGGGGNILSCIPADQAARRLRRAIEKNTEARAERLWTERNFPRLKRVRGTFGACVGLLDAEEEKESATVGAEVVGREVAPHQFVLSFNRTKGGLSYTLGSPSGGRGFFVHPPARHDRHPPLELLQGRQEQADQRRQRYLQRRVQQAQAMARRRRPPSPTPEEVAPPEPRQPEPPLVPETATRAAPSEFAEVPLWEDPDEVAEKRGRKHRKPKERHPDRGALWHKIAHFFVGKNTPTVNSSHNIGGLDALQSHSMELHPCPESMSLPNASLPRRSSDDSESPGRTRIMSARGQSPRGRSRPPGH